MRLRHGRCQVLTQNDLLKSIDKAIRASQSLDDPKNLC
jgi:hypothetical protein